MRPFTGTTATTFRLHKQFPILELNSSIIYRRTRLLMLPVKDLAGVKKKKHFLFLTTQKPAKNGDKLGASAPPLFATQG